MIVKRIITILSILFVILICAFWGIHHIKQTNQLLNQQLDAILFDIQQENDQQALTKTKQLKTHWEQQSNYFGMYLQHHLLDQVTSQIALLETSIQEKEYLQAQFTITQIRITLEQIYDDEQLKLRNIL